MMSTEPANEVLAAWETSSQYWTKHQSLIAAMFVPLTDALVETAPGIVIFGGVEVVSLGDVELAAVAGLFDEGRVSGGKPGGDESLGHGVPPTCFHGSRVWVI